MNPTRRPTEIRLVGGLGNQLFGLAAGRFLRENFGHEVCFNTWHLGRLGFDHGATLAGRAFDERFVSRRPMFGLRHKKIMQNLPTRTVEHHSRDPGWDESLAKVERGARVSGYFQSWRYPSALENRFCPEDLVQASGPSSWLREETHRAREVRPVIVHLRRGDYRLVADSFGLVGPDFLKKAVQRVRSLGLDNPIWVFSDEPNYARQIFFDLRLDARLIEPPDGADPGESLALMSEGIAHVISNSTFAWWGAFLSRSSRITIAPQPWFRSIPEPTDLIPKGWLRLGHTFSTQPG